MNVVKKSKICVKKMVSKVRGCYGKIYATLVGLVAVNFGAVSPAYAAQGEMLSSVIKLLGGGICCLGGGLVVWGLVQLGMGWKDGSGGGGQINGALGFIIGGAAVFGAGLLMANIDTSWINV